MYTANMSCKTSVAILEIGTGEKAEMPRLNESSDIDLSLKRKYLLLPYCHVHLSCGMVVCHGVAESSESDDIKLSNFEAETTLDSKQCWFVYETCLSSTDKQHDFNYVIDLVCILHRVPFEKSGGETKSQHRKIIGRKQRKKKIMKGNSWYKQHKKRHLSLTGEQTSQPGIQRHRKKCCTMKRYRMFKFRMFLVFIILRVSAKVSKASNGKEFIDGEDAEQAFKELSLNFCLRTKIFLHFYLCDSKKFNGQFEIVLHCNDDMTGDTEIEKVLSSEAFENVLHDKLSVRYFVVPKNVLHCRMFGDRLVDEGESVLQKDVSADSSIQVKNVPHKDVSGDSSLQVDKNALHNDLSEDSSIEGFWNFLHKNVLCDSSIQVVWNVLQNDLSGNSYIHDRNVLDKNMSGNSSIQVDKNVLPLSGDSSIRDKNVLQKDVSGDSSIQVDKNVPFNDICGDSPVFENMPHNLPVNSAVTIENKANNNGDGSIKICGNDLFKDLPENIWLEICQNVLPIGVFESKCVDIVLHSSPADKISGNNLHTDLFDSSESVKISGNNLQNDLFQDSFESLKINLHNDLFEGSLEEPVKVIENNLHTDLFEDSLESIKINENNHHNNLFEDSEESVKISASNLHTDLVEDSLEELVKVNGNNLHNDLFEDSLESIKINENNHHNNLFEDSEESVKTSKNMVSDAVFEDSTFIMSKRFHNMKFNVSNTNDTKATDSADWMFNSSGSDDIRSYMDFLRLLGIYPRCSPSLPMFWQEITLYPFTHVNNPPGDLHQLMRYEVFRLCSFSYARFPADFDVWVTRLAQAGFYCENESGRIVCFNCGCEFHGTVGSSIADVHHPECQRHEHSRPLNVWTEGLNQEILTVYYNRYGSLRPYNFEMTNQQNLSDDADSAHRSIQGSAVSQPQAQSEQASGEQASGGMSEGRELGVSVLAEVTREDSTIEEAARPEYHSVTLPADLGETAHDHGGFGDQQQSLPGNLNEVSGAIVSEESQDTPRSYQILTSAAKKPMEFNSAAARGSHSQAEHSNDNGAVGGVGVTFDLSKASYPLFSSAEARRQTFTSWSRTHSHRPEDLATAGFFYAGYADCVRCFFCGLGLKYWRPNDIPAYQHARYRPHCVYNRMYKGQDYIDRVQQDLRSEQGTGDQPAESVPQDQGEAMRAVVARQARVLDEMAPATGTPSVTAPNAPDLMNSEVAQEAMRNGWDRNQVQQAVDHIVREFGVHCLEISLLLDVLTNLNMDNPEGNLPSGGSVGSADSGINERAVLPSTAAAESVNVVSVGRGVDVADNGHGGADESSQTRAVPIQQPAVPPIEFNELFRSVEREHTLLAERTTCRLCRRRPVSCIYLPCGHVIACQECADNATHCILCSKQIIGTANIYLA